MGEGGGRGPLYVNLFIPSELNWDGTIVRQETTFPESNKTTLTVKPLTVNPEPLTLKIRYPYWATYMKINGRKVKADKDGYVLVKNAKHVEVEFGMILREEPTKDDPAHVALLRGPIVMAGRLGKVDNPFSDPKKYNDYYTFDYGKHPDVPIGSLPLEPFYNMQHCRYVVYWKK